MSDLNRRALIKGALEVSWALPGTLSFGMSFAWDTTQAAGAEENGPKTFTPSHWLHFHRDGRIVFILDRVEMGQGVMTTLPLIIAEEIGVDPAKIEVQFAPADRKFGNPEVAGMQVTGGSSSIKAAWSLLREAGAQARTMFVHSAAELWSVPVTQCTVVDGLVRHGPTGNEIAYSQLVDRPMKLGSEDVAQPKDPSKYTRIGQQHLRRDAIAKVTGGADFGVDVAVENALIACVARTPRRGAKSTAVDEKDCLATPGVQKVVRLPHGVAVLATNYWAARSGVGRLKIEWSEGPRSELDEQYLRPSFANALIQPGKRVRHEGNPDAEIAGGMTLKGQYSLPFLAHATMEPQNCTAWVRGKQCDVWAPTQAPGLALEVARLVTGLSADDIKIHQTFLGGGFGRRLYQDFIVEAVTLAMLVDKPVKVMWSREDDFENDFYRPAALHNVEVRLKDGKIATWRHKVATPSILSYTLSEWVPGILPQFTPAKWGRKLGELGEKVFKRLLADNTSTEGISDTRYKFENFEVYHVPHDPGVAVGFWRSVGHSHTAFAMESMIDEAALALDVDPIALRIKHLPEKSSQVQTLQAVAKLCDWQESSFRQGSGVPTGRMFRGVAVHESFGSTVAEVVEILWTGADADVKPGNFTVRKVWCVVDCGIAVSPDLVRSQIEGGVIFALSAALYGRTSFKQGRVEQNNFDTHPVLRCQESPEISVEILANHDDPRGVGEPGVPPLAAALTAALARAIGKRFRSLPLFST